MSTNLDNTAVRHEAICSKINTSIAAIAKMEIERVQNTAASFIAMANELLGKKVEAVPNAIPVTVKSKVKPKKRAALKKKARAIAVTTIEKAAVAEAAAPAAPA